MKKRNKMMVCSAMFVMLSGAMTSFAGEWKGDAKGYWYAKDNGGYAVSEWLEDDGKWYYIADDGYMLSNTWVGNYYVGADGAMLINTTTPDGFQVGSDGAWISSAATYPQASYAAFMINPNVYMYGYDFGYQNTPCNGYGAIRGEVSDVIDCGDYYELKNQKLTQAKQYNTKKEANTKAKQLRGNGYVGQLSNGKYYVSGDNDMLVSEVVYQGSIYINKDVIVEYHHSGAKYYTTLMDYLNRLEEIGQNGGSIGAVIKGIDEKGYVTYLEDSLDYFW